MKDFANDKNLDQTKMKDFANDKTLDQTKMKDFANDKTLDQTKMKDFANDKNLDQTKMKDFANDKINVTKTELCLGKVETILGEKEKCCLSAFSPFPAMFSKSFFLRVVNSRDCAELNNLRPCLGGF